jgi:hypothetical protein
MFQGHIAKETYSYGQKRPIHEEYQMRTYEYTYDDVTEEDNDVTDTDEEYQMRTYVPRSYCKRDLFIWTKETYS